MIFFVVGIEAKTEVHAKNWSSRMIFTFYLIFCKKKKKMPLSSLLSLASTGQNVVLCHILTKSLQVRPDNNKGINTALLATSMVRTGWEKRSWFSLLILQ